MKAPDIGKITTDKLILPLVQNKNVQLDILRLDKIHPVISGNKWFKLKYHLDNYNAGNYKGIVTFGGAWSNHIVATACTCYIKKINCFGIIRGEKPKQLSFTLEDALKYEMHLIFISREMYKQKDSEVIVESIQKDFPYHYLIPEGGAGETGEKGAREILQYADVKNYTHIVCAVGTGTMFMGLKKVAVPGQNIIGIVVLKGWEKEINDTDSKLFLNYHFGGYAKFNKELLAFMNEFYTQTNIPTDFVYTGKLAFAIFDLINNNYFAEGSKILMIHSGGLQGNRSLQKGSLIF